MFRVGRMILVWVRGPGDPLGPAPFWPWRQIKLGSISGALLFPVAPGYKWCNWLGRPDFHLLSVLISFLWCTGGEAPSPLFCPLPAWLGKKCLPSTTSRNWRHIRQGLETWLSFRPQRRRRLHLAVQTAPCWWSSISSRRLPDLCVQISAWIRWSSADLSESHPDRSYQSLPTGGCAGRRKRKSGDQGTQPSVSFPICSRLAACFY